MSTLKTADEARAAASRMADLPAFLQRRESGATASIRPMTFGPATAPAPRVEPSMLPPAAAPLAGVSIAHAVYGRLAMLFAPKAPFALAKDGSAAVHQLRPEGTLSILFQDAVWALTFTRPLPEMGQDFVDSYSLELDHTAQTAEVLTRRLDIAGPMEADQADHLSALLGELDKALDRGAAGKIKLAPLAKPKTEAAPLPAMARTLAALDSGADQMPPSLDTMTAPEQRAELAPFQAPTVALAADAARLEPRPGAATGGVVVSLRPSSPSTGRAFPRPIDQVPAASMLPPPAPPPRPQDRTPEELEAECLALLATAQAAALRERRIKAPDDAFEFEEDAETGALTCRPVESHPCWQPAPARAMAPRKRAAAPPQAFAPAPLPQAPKSAPAAVAAPQRARKPKAQQAPAPVPAAAPASPKARKPKDAPKNKSQVIDFEALIGRVIETKMAENAAKLGEAIDRKFAAALDKILGN